MTLMYSAGTQISSTMTQVSCGSPTNIWGVDAAHNFYQYTGSGTNWTQIPGAALKQVSVASDGTIWGINPSGLIYQYAGNNTWTQIPGNLAQVSVGSASLVWGVNSAGTVYQYAGNNTWTQISTPSVFIQVSVASNGTVWGVNTAGAVFQYTGSTWTQIATNTQPGGPNIPLTQLSIVAQYPVLGLDAQGNTYLYNNGASVYPWEQQTTFPLAQSLSLAPTTYTAGALIDLQGITHTFNAPSF